MNIIFLTLYHISDIEERGIYQDLMRKFRDEGHSVYIVTAAERRLGKKTSLVESYCVRILNVKTLNVQKTNIVEKGIGTLFIESQFKAAIKKYLGNVQFDLITYSTPPITFTNVVRFLKQKNPKAITYLQLKDIFPQNAVDIGLFGEKSVFNWYFRKKEKALYNVSDYIGCMSPANVKFVLDHNPEIPASKVEVAPNSLELKEIHFEDGQENAERYYIRRKYDIPTDRPVFIYGGNLGKPQGIPFLIDCLSANSSREDCFFMIIGTGTELPKLREWNEEKKPRSVKVMNGLPKDEYDMLVRSCDVGLVFLDHRFTIPNYPSRLLSYLENKMPVLCATDPNTDMGAIAEANGYGYWCESNSVVDFTVILEKMIHSDRQAMGEKGYEFLENNYLVEHTYNAIVKHLV